MDINQYKQYAPVALRIALALVFLWFGVNQLINPQSFLGYVPQWLSPHPTDMMHEHPLQLLHDLPLTPHVVIMGNGIFESIFGLLLLLGLFTRVSSLLLSLHLFFIAFSLGYNDLMIRDLGLSLATFSIFLHGADVWSLDRKVRR